jgi:hypothetical protein
LSPSSRSRFRLGMYCLAASRDASFRGNMQLNTSLGEAPRGGQGIVAASPRSWRSRVPYPPGGDSHDLRLYANATARRSIPPRKAGRDRRNDAGEDPGDDRSVDRRGARSGARCLDSEERLRPDRSRPDRTPALLHSPQPSYHPPALRSPAAAAWSQLLYAISTLTALDSGHLTMVTSSTPSLYTALIASRATSSGSLNARWMRP